MICILLFLGESIVNLPLAKLFITITFIPLWDEFGSSTLYMKILMADYQEGYAIIELIGEWNDAIENDIMILKRDVIDNFPKTGYKEIYFDSRKCS